MNLRRPTVVRLIVFGVVAVVALAVVAVQYVQAPQQAGIGRYAVTVEMDDAGGLYPNANVTFRGVTVGRVVDVVSTRDGARAELSLRSGVDVPADADAQILGMSAVGEMYIDLVPRGTRAVALREGSRIPADRVRISADTGEVLRSVNELLDSVPRDELTTVIDESFVAVKGQGPALRSLVDSVTGILASARDADDPAATLLDELGPLLTTQEVSGDAIRAWASSLARVTGTVADADAGVRGVLDQAGPAAREATRAFNDFEPLLPMLLSNLVTVEQVAAVYNPGLEQILVLFPPLIAASQGAGIVNADDPGQNTYFALGLNDPPPCIEGFIPAAERRSPTDLSRVETPDDLYCKVEPGDPRSVRGARNLPCIEYPGYRAATVQLCRQKAGGSAPRGAVRSGDGPKPKRGDAAARGTGRSRVKVADYDATRGTYLGSDGVTYAVAGLMGEDRGDPPTLRSMLTGR
ncbi:MCE family protein [Gordonia shandongensis]|uniref:MCE family protein n=1 Tax=Gordonia shandongensis TaxID=376351 RepID=UPI0004163547|nr:MlaD family protein [Gordonia shandongensis]